jgi:hypothetical protein
MKTISKHSFPGCFLLAAFFVFAGCHKNNDTKPTNEISHNDSTALVEIFQDISNDNHTILDIPSIPVPDEFLNSGDAYIKQVAELIEMFNNFIKNPQNTDSTDLKSIEATSYTKHCETFGAFTECVFEQDHGAYKITIKQVLGPGGTTYEVYYSGIYDGVDYGDMYEVQENIFSPDGKSFYLFVYKIPVPPESAGELQYTYSMQVLDEMTIYTPWGEEHVRNVIYSNYIYQWDINKKESHINLGCQDIWEGNSLTMNLMYWSVAKEENYVGWVGTWDFEKLEGEWCSYDDDEMVIECGPM